MVLFIKSNFYGKHRLIIDFFLKKEKISENFAFFFS